MMAQYGAVHGAMGMPGGQVVQDDEYDLVGKPPTPQFQ